MSDIAIADHPEASRYEALSDGQVAGYLEHHEADGTVVLPHTEVDPAFSGRGVGSLLARHALDDARERGLRVVPTCPFVAGYIERHPEYRDLVADEGAAQG